MNQLQNQVQCVPKTIRTKVLAHALDNLPCLEYPRIIFPRNANTWVTLSIFQQDIIVRLMLLDKIILQQKRILFALHHHIADICDLFDQQFGFVAVLLFMEITTYTPFQVLGFTHIDHFPNIVEVLVHSWLLWQPL